MNDNFKGPAKLVRRASSATLQDFSVVRNGIVCATTATATTVIARCIISAATAAGCDGVIGAASATDMADGVVATTALAYMANGIVCTATSGCRCHCDG
jgi:hypothetical protein